MEGADNEIRAIPTSWLKEGSDNEIQAIHTSWLKVKLVNILWYTVKEKEVILDQHEHQGKRVNTREHQEHQETPEKQRGTPGEQTAGYI